MTGTPTFVHPFHLGVSWLVPPDPVVWHAILEGDRALPSGVGPADRWGFYLFVPILHTTKCFAAHSIVHCTQSTGNLVSFVLRVPGLEGGVLLGVKALGWMAGTLIWMPGAPGARRANVPSFARRYAYLAGAHAWCTAGTFHSAEEGDKSVMYSFNGPDNLVFYNKQLMPLREAIVSAVSEAQPPAAGEAVDLQDTLLGHTVLVLGPDQVEIVPEEVCPRRRARGRLNIRTADNHRRRIPPSPPDQSDHRGKKRNLQSGKSCWATFGTQNFGSQTPEPPPPPPWLF